MNNQDVKRCREFVWFCNHVEAGSMNARIADSVLSQAHDLNSLTLDCVARMADVSVPTASRFFRSAGFASFSEFRTLFPVYMERVREYRHSYATSAFAMDQGGILHDANELCIRNLASTFQKLDMAEMKGLAEMMLSASRVYFIGESAELQVLFQLQLDLLSRGIASIQCDIAESEDILKLPINDNTVCIFVNVYSGWYMNELVSLAASARSKGSAAILFHQGAVYHEEVFTKTILYGSVETIEAGFASVCMINRILCDLIAVSPLKNS